MTDDLQREQRRRLAALADATERAERLGDRYAIQIAKIDELLAARLDHEARLARLEAVTPEEWRAWWEREMEVTDRG